MRLILASASPRRAQLLRAAGFAFEVEPADVDERSWPGELPEAYVRRVALDKARAVRARIGDGDGIVLAADTAVVVDHTILGKPVDEADAARMLRMLSGRWHEVLTGVALVAASGERTAVEITRVWFRELSARDIDRYVGSGEPADKAGAYAVQGLASRFVERVDGSCSNVVGLPVALVARLLDELEFSEGGAD